MHTHLLGQTVEGLPLWAHEFKPAKVCFRLLVLGGVHGDEPEGVVLAQALLADLQKHYPYNIHLHLVPVLNPHGLWHLKRTNANRVDLNRNLPTSDWSPQAAKPKYHPGPTAGSEAENKALLQLLQASKPDLVVSLHSWHPLLNTNGNCREVAEVIAHHTGYKVKDDIGYPTPGSLGTYCTQVLDIPCLTYECERGLKFARIVNEHRPALHKALKFLSSSTPRDDTAR